MKRMIVCRKCAAPKPLDLNGMSEAQLKEVIFGIRLSHYMKEETTRMNGLALADYMCDFCGIHIKEGEECVALSYSSESAPYYPWEDEYVKPINRYPVPK